MRNAVQLTDSERYSSKDLIREWVKGTPTFTGEKPVIKEFGLVR